MRFEMNRDYLTGEHMESLIEKEENNWISKKELAEICKCSTRVLEQIVADAKVVSQFKITLKKVVIIILKLAMRL